MNSDAAQSSSAQMSISEISIDDVVDAYDRHDFGRLSDAELVAEVASVVAVPRRDQADSFVLHAPLELAARSALLPAVAPEQRKLARVRILAIAAQYNGYPAVASSGQLTPEGGNGKPSGLAEALASGDIDGAEAEAVTLADSMTGPALARVLAGTVISSTAAAAHAPIFLFHIARRESVGGLSTRLLRPLARELARQPDWRIRWTDDWQPNGATDPGRLAHALAEIPLVDPGSTFIHPLLMQVDEGGAAADLLGPVLGARTPEAATGLLRIAARLMLTDTPDHAPYGWTHCFSIPQAVLGCTEGTEHADLGLAVAATHVAAFRSGLGNEPLDLDRPLQLQPVDRRQLVSRAATAHDAHVVKYVLACIDASHDDPSATPLYMAAAQRLLDVWDDRGGDPTDPLRS